MASHLCSLLYDMTVFCLLHTLQFSDKEIKAVTRETHPSDCAWIDFHWMKRQGQSSPHLLGWCCWAQGMLCLSCSGDEIFTTNWCRCCSINFAKGSEYWAAVSFTALRLLLFYLHIILQQYLWQCQKLMPGAGNFPNTAIPPRTIITPPKKSR